MVMIEVGSRVKLKDGRAGLVVELREGFARVLPQNTVRDEWYPIEEIEEELSLVERLLRNDVDDGIDFILSIDAYRLLTEYKFNPYVLASSTKITIYPHQIDEVIRMLERPRMMLADEVGLGKTIAAILTACELKARGLVKKMLFVVPKSLVYKWVRELSERFEIDVEILDSNYVRMNPRPFEREEFCYVSSMDYLKQDHVIRLFDNASIDVVVVDEAHKLTPGTERYDLGKKLSEKAGFMFFLTATPHRGSDEEYLERMRLLDPYILDTASASSLVIRNLKEDVVDIEGREVFPPRSSRTVSVNLTSEELKLHRMIDEYVGELLQNARDRRQLNATRFVGTILRKRASSSPRALRESLHRRLMKLRLIGDFEESIRRMGEAEEEFDEREYEEAEDSLIGLTVEGVRGERDRIMSILEELDKLDGKDSKLEQLVSFIEEAKKGDPEAKIVIFTEYRDTAYYLHERLSEKYRVGLIHGLMPNEERQRELDRFRPPEGYEIMVGTDAAGEGIDMQFANIEINYDLPWNPNRLEQRMGRIHRIGQKRNVYYYNFILSDTVDGYILSRVLEKIEAIRAAMGERAYDVIGRLISEEDIISIYEELIKAPRDRWEPQIRRIDGIIEEKRRILQEVEKLLSGHRLDRSRLEDFRKVQLYSIDKGEVKRFIEVYVNRSGGRVELKNPEEERYVIFLPRKLAYLEGRGIIEGSFSSETAQEKGYPYLALGNRHVMKMVNDAAKPSVSIFMHDHVEGIIYVYRLTIRDGKGQERDGKLIALLYDGGRMVEVDPRFIWDLQPVEDTAGTELETSRILDGKRLTEKEAYRMLEELKKRCEEKLMKVREKTRDIITSYFSEQIRKCEERIQEYKRRMYEAPNYDKLVRMEEGKKKRYRDEMMKKIEELEREYKLTGFHELIGLAIILKREEGDVRKTVERAGVEAVLAYERERAGGDREKLEKIRDVSDSLRGYDIESFDRVIEVKSFKTTGPVELTSHEWQTASRMRDVYWLYVVENALTKPHIHTIQNPVEKFKNRVKKIPITDYRYVIEDWKEQAG
jgi:superfamily II DNA or RNA helicase